MSSPESDLNKSTTSGMAWSLLATAGGRLINLAALAVLARLLAPTDFGLLAFALVFIGYLETVGDLGTSMALIYWPDKKREVAQLTFVIGVATSFLWFALTWFSAPAVAAFFGSPAGEPILQVLSLTFIIKALGNTHDALLQRELRFRTRVFPELGLMAGKAAIAIPLAFAGFGAWSLVWGQLIGQALSTVLLWALVPWRPGWWFPTEMVRPVAGYGRGIVAVNVLAAVVHHIDIVIVGRMFSMATLGYYQIATKLPDVSVTLLVRVAGKVLFPTFSRLHAGGYALRDVYLKSLHYIALLTMPICAGLVILAEPLVLTVFGEQWQPSIPLLQVFAIYAGIRALGSFAGDVLKGTGRPGLLASIAAVRAVVLVPLLIYAASFSVVAVAFALAVEAALSTSFSIAVASRLLDINVKALIVSLRLSVVTTTVVALTLLATSYTTAAYPPVLQLLTPGLVGAIVYAGLVLVFDPRLLRQVSHLTQRYRRGNAVEQTSEAEEQSSANGSARSK